MAKGQVPLKRLNETEARALFEDLRWKDGVYCPHCGNADASRITLLKGTSTRHGVRKCKECRKPFSATVGTLLEHSRINMADWMYAYAAMCASKKGISAHQLHRELGVQYKTAWFMCHRIRLSMGLPTMDKLTGTVIVDEKYIGGKPRNPGERKPKIPVVTLVEKGGRARSKATADVTGKTLRKFIMDNVDSSATIMSDENTAYRGIGKHFQGGHHTVNHSQREYARGEVTSNEVESYYSNLQRGLIGTFHHVSPRHLGKYLLEFDMRWSTRKMNDTDRTFAALRGVAGKRLLYRAPAKAQTSADVLTAPPTGAVVPTKVAVKRTRWTRLPDDAIARFAVGDQVRHYANYYYVVRRWVRGGLIRYDLRLAKSKDTKPGLAKIAEDDIHGIEPYLRWHEPTT